MARKGLRVVSGDEGEIGKEELQEYQEAASSAVSSVESKEQRANLQKVFNELETLHLYRDLRSNGFSETEAADLLKYGAVHYNVDEEGRKSIATVRAGVYHAIGDAVKRAGGHESALRAMRKDGYMKEREHEDFSGRIKRRVENHLEHLARAAVWLFMAVGAILMLVSGYAFTAAVVGSAFEVTSLFVIGLILFVMGMILWVKK